MPNAPDFDDRGLPRDYPFDADREVAPRDLKRALDAGEPIDLIDCRGEDERAVTHLGGRLVPLPELAERFEEDLAGREGDRVVVYCRSGKRSLAFADALRRAGFRDAKSLAGGVNLWNTVVEPGRPTY